MSTAGDASAEKLTQNPDTEAIILQGLEGQMAPDGTGDDETENEPCIR